MNERPRLKDRDQILRSLEKHIRIPAEDAEAEAQAQAEAEAAEAAPRRRRGRPPRSNQELEERIEQADANPLDFGKYELPRGSSGNRRKSSTRGRAIWNLSPPPPPEPEDDGVDPFVLAEDEEVRSQFINDINSTFDEKFSQRFATPPQKPAKEVIDRVAQELGIRPKNEPEEEEPEEEPEPLEIPEEPEAVAETVEAAAPLEPEAVKPKVITPVELPDLQPVVFEEFVPEEELAIEMTAGGEADEDEEIKREAENFLRQFVEETQQQEEVQSQDFKETLAEKFMRERERYLRELGIADQMEQELERQVVEEAVAAQQEPAHPASSRRVLDFQIQPEMHMKDGEETPARPVTYGRNAVARPMEDRGELPYVPRSMQQQEVQQPAKKSAEELLMELAAHKTMRTVSAQFQPPRQPVQAAPQPAGEQQNPLLPVEIRDGAGEKTGIIERIKYAIANFRLNKMVLASAAIGLMILALIMWPLSIWLSIRDVPGEEAPAPVELADASGDTLDVYENRTFEPRGQYNNVRVHKPGITLQNLTVERNLIIEEIPSSGTIYLSNVTVNGSILVRDSAIESLELDNVQAREVVVSNSQADVSVQLGDMTTVEKLEIRSPTAVTQREGAEVELDEVLIKNQGDRALNVTLTGTTVKDLGAEGDTFLRLVGSQVESLTADGSLSLDGEGKVRNLSATQWQEQPLVLTLKGVPVTNLYLKSPANVNVSAPVDYAFTSDRLNLAGNSVLSSLDINEKFGNARLTVDISGLNVQILTANTEVTVNGVGSTQVNTLTANESVYTLGNKVNHLIVNADGVIYENRPDRITVADGIAPPQSVEDNPNVDFALTRGENTGITDATDDDVATTCNDPRESGGYLKGDGSADNPFEVTTPAQLAHVSKHLNAHFIQMGDIDISDDSQFASGFVPIASGDAPFSGVYDGNGFSIRGLRMTSADTNVGMFASNVGTIKNVHVATGDITATGSGNVFVGGIVGFNYQGGLVTSSSNGALVNGSSSAYAGGIVGYNYGGRVRDSYNYAKISGGGTVGGVVGVNLSGAMVVSCYNVGTISGDGILGAVAGSNDSSAITNCYYLADTAEDAIGSGSGTAVEVSSDRMQSEQMVVDLSVGADDAPWIRGSGSYDYPMLRAPVTIRSASAGDDVQTPVSDSTDEPEED